MQLYLYDPARRRLLKPIFQDVPTCHGYALDGASSMQRWPWQRLPTTLGNARGSFSPTNTNDIGSRLIRLLLRLPA